MAKCPGHCVKLPDGRCVTPMPGIPKSRWPDCTPLDPVVIDPGILLPDLRWWVAVAVIYVLTEAERLIDE